MTLLEYLNRATYLNEKITEILNRADILRKSLYGRGVNYENSGSSGGGSCSDPIGRAMAKIIDFENSADELIEELITVKMEIQELLSTVTDRKLRKILERKYICFDSNETIAADMKYSVNHVYKLHNQAIKDLEKKWIKIDKN